MHKNLVLFTIKLVCHDQQMQTCVFCVRGLALINSLAWPPLPLINTAMKQTHSGLGKWHTYERDRSHIHTQRHLCVSLREQRNILKAHSSTGLLDCLKHIGTLCLSSAQVVFSLSGFTMLVVRCV